MIERIICAGSGGQGVMAMGKVIALSALREGRFATWLPSYGAEVRGGTAHCMVVVSDQPIASPTIERADTLIIMNQPSLKRFRESIRDKGLLIVNASMVEGPDSSRRLKVVRAPLNEMAARIGKDQVANTVAIGVYLGLKKILSLSTMEKAIEEVLAHKPEMAALNKRALSEGFFFAQKLKTI